MALRRLRNLSADRFTGWQILGSSAVHCCTVRSNPVNCLSVTYCPRGHRRDMRELLAGSWALMSAELLSNKCDVTLIHGLLWELPAFCKGAQACATRALSCTLLDQDPNKCSACFGPDCNDRHFLLSNCHNFTSTDGDIGLSDEFRDHTEQESLSM